MKCRAKETSGFDEVGLVYENQALKVGIHDCSSMESRIRQDRQKTHPTHWLGRFNDFDAVIWFIDYFLDAGLQVSGVVFPE